MSCEKGMIKEISFMGDFFGYGEKTEICRRLVGVRMRREEIIGALYDIDRYIHGATPQLIADLIFDCC